MRPLKRIIFELIVILGFTIVTCNASLGFFCEEEEQSVEPSLQSKEVQGVQGDIVGLSISPGTAESIGIKIGDYAENNYELSATVDSGVASEVVLRFDTTAAGDSYDTLWADGAPNVSLVKRFH